MILGFVFGLLVGCADETKQTEEEPNTSTEAEQDTADSAVDTDVEPESPPLSLRTEFGSEDTLNVEVDDIFAIWWDPAFDHSQDLAQMFQWLKEIRYDCLDNLDMEDPPNPSAGYYYNVYIHHGEEDSFPNWWGNGQGTDTYGMPYLTLPNGAHLDHGNILHEGFHVFQYSANSPGFSYSGDSQWYVESAAQWYQAQKLPNEEMTFVEAGAIVENPQLALWHSFSNEAPGDPTDWLYQVRQYGMHTYLYYLTAVAGVDSEIISGGFYAQTDLSPQAYHFDNVGGDILRSHFADWAARNTGGLDYLTDAQVARAWLEVDLVGDPNNRHPLVGEFTDGDAEGDFQPPSDFLPRGWGYNVIKINNTAAAKYTFVLSGDGQGSEGADAHFAGRIVVMGATGPQYTEVNMSGSRNGMGAVDVLSSDTSVFLVVAAVPEHFSGNQTYGYTVQIIRDE